jgi:hypothetical protein
VPPRVSDEQAIKRPSRSTSAIIHREHAAGTLDDAAGRSPTSGAGVLGELLERALDAFVREP